MYEINLYYQNPNHNCMCTAILYSYMYVCFDLICGNKEEKRIPRGTIL